MSGLDVVEVLAAAEGALSMTEIAARVGLSKPSVHQLLASLCERGYVRRQPDQAYVVGIKAWEVGCVAAPLGMARLASPHMERLVREVEDGVSLGVLVGAEMVCIHLVEGVASVRVHDKIGARTPAHCFSGGIAVLSMMADEDVLKILPETLTPATDLTIVSREALLAELARARRAGFAASRGAWRSDVAGVAAGVRGPDGYVAAALTVAMPAYRATEERVAAVAPRLLETAARIETEFGAPPSGVDQA